MGKVHPKQREWARKWREAHPGANQVYVRKWQKNYRDDHRARGLCVCCDNPPEPGRAKCKECSIKHRAMVDKLRAERLANNICIFCSEPALENNRLGLKCYLKSTASRHLGTSTRWPELLELWNQQQGRCALSGATLTLGVNADLDHIIPRARGGDNDISNLQWVLESVNTLKRDMLESELFTLIEMVYLAMKARQAE